VGQGYFLSPKNSFPEAIIRGVAYYDYVVRLPVGEISEAAPVVNMP